VGFRNAVQSAGATTTPVDPRATLVGLNYYETPTTGQNLDVRIPGTVKAGDVLLMTIFAPDGITITIPAGWTQLRNGRDSDNTHRFFDLFKIAAAGDAGARARVSNANGGGGYRTVQIIAIRPVTTVSAGTFQTYAESKITFDFTLAAQTNTKLVVLAVTGVDDQDVTSVGWATAATPPDPAPILEGHDAGANLTRGHWFFTVNWADATQYKLTLSKRTSTYYFSARAYVF